MSRVAGLVLAAGAGRRFGGPKALATLDGERLVDRAVRVLRTGGCDRVVVVIGAAAVQVRGVDVVDNPQWRTGMGSSLRAGLAAVTEDAVVVIPVDMPWLGPAAVARVIAAYEAGAGVVTATYAGQRRHPVLLARRHFAEVSRLAVGDVGARPFLRAHPDLVVEVACDDTGSPQDIDTPDSDAARVRRGDPGPAARPSSAAPPATSRTEPS
jgi:nicotine blue oxidoreductase